MVTEIRLATPADAPAIALIIEQVFGEQVTQDRIRACIESHVHTTYVADDAGVVAGFVDGFPTMSAHGQRRFELDLIGVQVLYQGRGIGKQLIDAMTSAAQQQSAAIIRALVAVDNRPMQSSMIYRAFTSTDEIYHLFVKPASESRVYSSRSASGDAHMIAVQTLTYSGIWLEGDITAATLHRAYAKQAADNVELVGAVVLQADLSPVTVLRSAAFHEIGQYQWWQRWL